MSMDRATGTCIFGYQENNNKKERKNDDKKI